MYRTYIFISTPVNVHLLLQNQHHLYCIRSKYGKQGWPEPFGDTQDLIPKSKSFRSKFCHSRSGIKHCGTEINLSINPGQKSIFPNSVVDPEPVGSGIFVLNSDPTFFKQENLYNICEFFFKNGPIRL